MLEFYNFIISVFNIDLKKKELAYDPAQHCVEREGGNSFFGRLCVCVHRAL